MWKWYMYLYLFILLSRSGSKRNHLSWSYQRIFFMLHLSKILSFCHGEISFSSFFLTKSFSFVSFVIKPTLNPWNPLTLMCVSFEFIYWTVRFSHVLSMFFSHSKLFLSWSKISLTLGFTQVEFCSNVVCNSCSCVSFPLFDFLYPDCVLKYVDY